jgi:deoxyribonuclease V
MIPQVPAYRGREFCRRELPPLRAVLGDLSGLGLLVVDGYADLDPGGRPGLGAQTHAEFGIPVIGVVKSRFRTATHAVPVLRGSSVRPFHQAMIGTPPLSRDSPIPRPGWCGGDRADVEWPPAATLSSCRPALAVR